MESTHHHREDQIIWMQITQGNELALVQLYDQYVDVFYSYGKKITYKSEIIEDAIQDLLAEIWYKRDKLSIPASVKGYVLKAFRQKLLRQLSRYKHISFTDAYAQMDVKDNHHYLHEQVVSEFESEFKAKLKKSLATLSPKEQEAIALKYTENLSHDEIASIMGIKKQTLYNLLHAAIQKLNKSLKEEQQFTGMYPIFMMAFLYLYLV